MKKTSFSFETDRYPTRLPTAQHDVVYGLTYTSDGLEDCHLLLSSYKNPDMSSLSTDSTLIILSKRDALRLAADLVKLYADN